MQYSAQGSSLAASVVMSNLGSGLFTASYISWQAGPENVELALYYVRPTVSACCLLWHLAQ